MFRLKMAFSFFAVLAFSFTFSVYAADCGDTDLDEETDTACACGDTVIGAFDYTYILTGNLTCTGHGLLFGSNNIVINGDGFTIDGDDNGLDYGIYNNGYDYVYTTNVTITDFDIGIYYVGNNNPGFLYNNTVNSNNFGIFLDYSISSELSGNIMSGNASGNLHISFGYSHSIDTTNLVEGKPVYYLSNQHGTAEEPLVYDGNVLGDIGMFWAIDSSYIQVKNATLSDNNVYGIYFNNTSHSTIENIFANFNNDSGIYLSSSDSNTLIGNTTNSNIYYGIYLSSSDSNTLIGNTVNHNRYYGLNLYSSAFNNLTGNIIYSNEIGIHIEQLSSSNTLTSNLMSENSGGNLDVVSSFLNTIDTTNLVEGKPVYYLYNQHGTAEEPLVYDGNVLGDIGMFWAIDSSYIQVKNATLSDNNLYGIYFNNTSHSTIENIIANSNRNYGIYLLSSDSNSVTGNTTNHNRYYGIYLSTSNSNILTGNSLYFNNKTFQSVNSNNSWSNNTFMHNLTNKMISFSEVDQTIALNDTVSFNFNMLNINGTACNNCTHTIKTYPSETINSISEVGNNVQGNFIATKPGIYTLTIQVTDISGNYEKRNYIFIVGNTDSTTKRFYLRDTNPTHGQLVNFVEHGDAKALVSIAPTEDEYWFCSNWLQNSPDEIPDYPLSNLDSVNIHSWYKQTDDVTGYIGIQRFAAYDNIVSQSQSIAGVADYTENDITFSNTNWEMDYVRSWYWFSAKLKGNAAHWRSTPENPSYVDFNYSYASAVPVKSVSNEEVHLLSATVDTTDDDNITIELENPSLTMPATTEIVLTSVNRPFLGISTTIDSTSTTTFSASSVAADSTVSISTANIVVIPATGSVDVLVSSWPDQANKTWIESGTGTLNTLHTVGNMKPNALYSIKVDNVLDPEIITGLNCTNGICLSDEYGEVIFTYTGTYSTHTFSVEEKTTTALEAITPITGTLQAGSVLTAGALTPTDAAVTYQWSRSTTIDGIYTDIS